MTHHELIEELIKEERKVRKEREHLIKIILSNTETALLLIKDFYKVDIRHDAYGYAIGMVQTKGGNAEYYVLSEEVYKGIKDQLETI